MSSYQVIPSSSGALPTDPSFNSVTAAAAITGATMVTNDGSNNGSLRIGGVGGGNAVYLKNNGVSICYLTAGDGSTYTRLVNSRVSDGQGNGVTFGSTLTIQSGNNLTGLTLDASGNLTVKGTLLASSPVQAITGATTAVVGDSRKRFDNFGAAAQAIVTLPAAAVGLNYNYTNGSAGATFAQFKAVGSDKFAYAGTVGAAAGTVTSGTTYGTITIVCSSSGLWTVTSATGTWTVA